MNPRVDSLPVIDVVILSWNRADSTLGTVSSVERQSGVIAKIWLVDQGSDESCLGMFRALAADGRITLHTLGENRGVAEGRNIGMALGQADYVVSIDNDAVFQDVGALASVVRRFEADPYLGAIGFRIVEANTGRLDRTSWVYPRSLLDTSKDAFIAANFCGCGHAIRRRALAKTQGYDSRLFFNWEERDLSYQLIEAGYQIIYDPAITVLHRVSSEARTDWERRRYYYLTRNALYLDYKYFRSPHQTATLALGYLVKGVYNGLIRQTVAGLKDAWALIQGLRAANTMILSRRAKRYIYQHDLRQRGSLWQRVRREVFDRVT
jgi:GT2 family glycosyltransferase